MRILFNTLFIFAIFCSCSSRNPKNESPVPDTAYVPIKTKGMMDQINLADSAALIYYNQPGNPRFFTVTQLHNPEFLSGLIEDINSPQVADDKDCPTLGKLYFYGKGDIVDVVYFSNNDSCMTFSWIKNGEKYFTPMGMASKKFIDSMKNFAREPRSRD